MTGHTPWRELVLMSIERDETMSIHNEGHSVWCDFIAKVDNEGLECVLTDYYEMLPSDALKIAEAFLPVREGLLRLERLIEKRQAEEYCPSGACIV